VKYIKHFELFDSFKRAIKDKKSNNQIVDDLLGLDLDESKISLLSDKLADIFIEYGYEYNGKLYKVACGKDSYRQIELTYRLKITEPEFEKLGTAGKYLGLDKVISASQSKIRKLFWKLKKTYESYQYTLTKYNL